MLSGHSLFTAPIKFTIDSSHSNLRLQLVVYALANGASYFSKEAQEDPILKQIRANLLEEFESLLKKGADTKNLKSTMKFTMVMMELLMYCMERDIKKLTRGTCIAGDITPNNNILIEVPVPDCNDLHIIDFGDHTNQCNTSVRPR